MSRAKKATGEVEAAAVCDDVGRCTACQADTYVLAGGLTSDFAVIALDWCEGLRDGSVESSSELLPALSTLLLPQTPIAAEART